MMGWGWWEKGGLVMGWVGDMGCGRRDGMGTETSKFNYFHFRHLMKILVVIWTYHRSVFSLFLLIFTYFSMFFWWSELIIDDAFFCYIFFENSCRPFCFLWNIFSCLFSLFFFILFRHHPFRNHPFQDLSFSGIILFRTYPFRIFLFRMNPFQELSLTGIFLFRLISFSGTMLFRSYLLQEMVLLQEYARLRVTQRILKYICGEIIQRQKEKNI